MKTLRYILYEENEYDLLAFNKYNKPGFIDDGAGWSEEEREEFEESVVTPLNLFEVGSFTYEVFGDMAELESKLQALGISRMEKGWT